MSLSLMYPWHLSHLNDDVHTQIVCFFVLNTRILQLLLCSSSAVPCSEPASGLLGISPAEEEVRRAPLCLRLTTFRHTATLELPPRGPLVF